MYRGTSLIRNSPTPRDHHRTLDSPPVWSQERGVSYERGTSVISNPLPLLLFQGVGFKVDG